MSLITFLLFALSLGFAEQNIFFSPTCRVFCTPCLPFLILSSFHHTSKAYSLFTLKHKSKKGKNSCFETLCYTNILPGKHILSIKEENTFHTVTCKLLWDDGTSSFSYGKIIHVENQTVKPSRQDSFSNPGMETSKYPVIL